MKRVGIAIQETWSFFNEIYTDLTNHYETTLFRRRSWRLPVFNTRINQLLQQHDLQSFMKANDVVFFEWASELLSVATHQPKVCRIVTRLHRYELYDWANRINWELVDRIILVSQAKKKEFIAKFPGQETKIIVCSPSTSLVKFSPQPKKYNGDIGILCHLSPRKRVYDLILSFYELIQKQSHFHLHIAGGTEDAYQDYYMALLHIIHDLDLQDKVTLYGNITDTWDWYHKIDIFISNSYSEGLQVAPMEAMASGCYCLSHHWDGADELLPPENLFYSNSELIDKIMAYNHLPDSEKQTQKNGMRAMACEKFDINKTSERIREIIDETANINQ